MLHRLVLSIELGTVQTGTGKIYPARKFICTTAALEVDIGSDVRVTLSGESPEIKRTVPFFILIQTIRCTLSHIVLIPFSSVQFQPCHSFPSLSHFIHSIQLFLIPSILSKHFSIPFIIFNPFSSILFYSVPSHPIHAILVISFIKKIFLIPFILSIPFSSNPFLSKPF